MAFHNLPVFNLTCNIYDFDPTIGLFALRVPDVPCQLQNNWKHAIGPIGQVYDPDLLVSWDAIPSLIKMPKLTDVRPTYYTYGHWGDIIEVVPGSHRYYQASQVDDCAKGFDNEYRIVLAYAIVADWPIPIP